jgi:hypothetical protein
VAFFFHRTPKQLYGSQGEGGQRLVEREVVLQVDGEPDVPALLVGLVEALDHPAGQQRAVDLDGVVDVLALLGPVLVVLPQQVLHRLVGVARPVDDVQHHRVRDGEAARERLRLGGDEALEGGLAPGDHALGRLLLHHPAARQGGVAGLGQGLGKGFLVLDDVLGGLHDDPARHVEAGPAGAAGDLVELARLEQPRLLAVVLGQRGEDDGADRHVDADAEGVGTADDLEQARLGQGLDQPAVLGQHAGVVDADAVPHEAGEGLAEAGGEPEVSDQLRDRVLLLAGAHVGGHERLRLLQRGGLGEVHDVHGRLVGGQQLAERLVQRLEAEGEDQRNRALGVLDHGGGPAGPPGQVLLEARHVAEGGGHQHELHLGQLDERHLPGPAPVGVGVVVELVHDDLADVGVGAVPQGNRGQHLGGAADDRGLGVDGGVAGHHADVGRAEDLAQREELLAHQGLDRRGVEAALAVGQRGEVRAGRDQGLARAGGGGQDHVRSHDDLDERLFLMRVQGEAAVLRPLGEGTEDGIRVRRGVLLAGRRRGKQIGERRHGVSIVPCRGDCPDRRAAESPVITPRSCGPQAGES